MKKIILLHAFAFILSIPARSQGWRIAPTVGINVAAISFSSAYRDAFNASNTSASFSPTVRWQVGALLDYSFSDRFSIRSGLLYTGKGSSLRVSAYQSGATATVRGSIQLNYLEVPFLLNIGVGANGLRIVGGPVLGIALNGKLASEAASFPGNGYYRGSNTKLTVGTSSIDGILPIELSASLGLVKELQLANRPLEIGLYAQPSFSSWDPSSNTHPEYTTRNLLVGLRIAYLFDLRR